MSTINPIDLLNDARERSYCIGYFECWDIESTTAVVRAAEKMKSPVMIGFCGEYLANPGRSYQENLKMYSGIVKKLARASSVPVATLLNESVDIRYACKGIGAGFDMVMFVDEKMSLAQLTSVQQKLVEFAHTCGVAVEAELGALPTANQSTGTQNEGRNTNPDLAAQFVRDTGVDALAVSIGNVHLLESKKAVLDLDLLERIHKKVTVPLVLHGGTGVDKAVFKEAVARGIAKVNVGAGLKRITISAYESYFKTHDVATMNPNHILGNGCPTDIQRIAHDKIVDEVATFIQAFGGENKAR